MQNSYIILKLNQGGSKVTHKNIASVPENGNKLKTF